MGKASRQHYSIIKPLKSLTNDECRIVDTIVLLVWKMGDNVSGAEDIFHHARREGWRIPTGIFHRRRCRGRKPMWQRVTTIRSDDTPMFSLLIQPEIVLMGLPWKMLIMEMITYGARFVMGSEPAGWGYWAAITYKTQHQSITRLTKHRPK